MNRSHTFSGFRRILTFSASALLLLVGPQAAAWTVTPAAEPTVVVVTGSVSSTQGPLQHARISFFRTCQEFAQGTGITVRMSTGTFSATLAPGPYRVRIEPTSTEGAMASWHPAKATCDEASEVTISGDLTLNLVAAPGTVMSGTATTRDGPIERGTVLLYRSCSDFHAGVTPTSVDITSGRYRTLVAPGDYWARFPAKSEALIESWHPAVTTCEQGTGVSLAGNSVTVDLVAKGLLIVSGQVRSKAGPVNAGTLQFDLDGTCTDYTATATIAKGAYSARLPAGRYRILIADAAAKESWHKAQPTCMKAQVVTITEDTQFDVISMGRTQSVKAPPRRLKKTASVKLARTTDRDSQVTWKSKTPAVCSVRKNRLTGIKRGLCRVSADTKSFAVPGLDTYTHVFKVRIR